MRSAEGSGFGSAEDFGALAQRYWSALSEALRSAGGAAQPQDPWRAALDGWSKLASGGLRGEASDAVERFSAQARQWLGAMQQVAGQFAGRAAGAEEIVAAWKSALGSGNPFADLMSSMTGRGQSGFDHWYAQVAPMLAGLPGNALLGGLREEGFAWLRMPAFGPAREHQERWQALAEAQLELQRCNDAYSALMLEAGQAAFERFERKLAERSEPGRQLQSARALFDLWIDAAEEAYAEIALSARFRRVYGELVNAQMRVRAGIQREVERIGDLFGLPGRTEVDAAHRRIAELERQVRRLTSDRRAAAPTRAATAAETEAKAPAAPGRKPAASAKPAAKRAGAAKANAKSKASAKASRAAAASPTRRAAKPAIAAIAMPDPLKPLPAKGASKRSAAAAKRKR